MVDPVTAGLASITLSQALTGASVLATVGGIGLQAVGAARQADSAAAAAEYDAAVRETQAAEERAIAVAEEERLRREDRARLGSLRARIAESGGGFTGSAMNVLLESAAATELDALTVRDTGARRAKALEIGAAASRVGATNTRSAGRLGVASTLLAGAGQVFGKYGPDTSPGSSDVAPKSAPRPSLSPRR